MIKLLHHTDTFSSEINGIRKVVFKEDEYTHNDTILFVQDFCKVLDSTKLILTTSKEVFDEYKVKKDILYFESSCFC